MTELKDTAVVLEFKNIQCNNKIKYDTFYLNPKAETFINESEIDHVFGFMFTNRISLDHSLSQRS